MRLFDPNNPSLDYFAVGPGRYAYLWCATARIMDYTGITSMDREVSTVYMKGLRMHGEYGFSGGITWRHRRIVFATKGVHDDNLYAETSDGYRRLWRAQSETQAASTGAVVFEGSGKDSSTTFTAKCDRSRIHVLYDKSRVYRAGNDQAHSHVITDYIPFEQNFTYNDDENGKEVLRSPWSSNNRNHLGDVFVWDIFTDVGATEEDSMTVRGDATLYWHEK